MNDNALVSLDRAQLALAECKTAMEAKQIADVAEAARVYLERTNASVETVNRATEIRLLAEKQMGAFLKTMPKAKGREYGGNPKVDGSIELPANPTPRLKDIGITKTQSARAQKLADIPEAEFKERIAVAKASGGKLSTAKILEPSEKIKKAMDEAEKDSDKLWQMKGLWKRASKRDRKLFLEWIRNN